MPQVGEEEEESSDGGARGGGFLAEGLYPRRRARIRVQEEEESATATQRPARLCRCGCIQTFELFFGESYTHACMRMRGWTVSSNTLATYWQHISNTLATHWQHITQKGWTVRVGATVGWAYVLSIGLRDSTTTTHTGSKKHTR